MPKLIKKLVESALPQEKRYIVWDSDVKGFGCRIYPSGQKTYVFFYRSNEDSRKKEFLKIGVHGAITCDIAREIARGWCGDLAGSVANLELR